MSKNDGGSEAILFESILDLGLFEKLTAVHYILGIPVITTWLCGGLVEFGGFWTTCGHNSRQTKQSGV